MQSSNVRRKHFWQARDWTDWLFSILLLLGAAGVYANYQSLMDGYEVFFLASSVVGFSLLGWFWSPIRSLIAGVAALSLSAIALYAGDLSLMQQKFLLRICRTGFTSKTCHGRAIPIYPTGSSKGTQHCVLK